MAARNKSKKTTKSKTKKTRPASSAKPASKRISKVASSSKVRSRAGKSKPASSARTASKTIRAKMKDIAAKPSKRKRKSPAAGTASSARGSAKRLAKAASARKPAASKSLNKGAKSATVKAALARARAKEAEAKLAPESRILGSSTRARENRHRRRRAGSQPGRSHSCRFVRIRFAGETGHAAGQGPKGRAGRRRQPPNRLGPPASVKGSSSMSLLFIRLTASVKLSRSKSKRLRASGLSCSLSAFQRTS